MSPVSIQICIPASNKLDMVLGTASCSLSSMAVIPVDNDGLRLKNALVSVFERLIFILEFRRKRTLSVLCRNVSVIPPYQHGTKSARDGLCRITNSVGFFPISSGFFTIFVAFFLRDYCFFPCFSLGPIGLQHPKHYSNANTRTFREPWNYRCTRACVFRVMSSFSTIDSHVFFHPESEYDISLFPSRQDFSQNVIGGPAHLPISFRWVSISL